MMQMGVNGCVWMRWGAGATGNTKTRYSNRVGFRNPMTGEISPDIMFWTIRPKVLRMGADGCRLFRVGAN